MRTHGVTGALASVFACACDIRRDAVVADRDAECHAAQAGEHAAAGEVRCLIMFMAQASLDARSMAAMMR